MLFRSVEFCRDGERMQSSPSIFEKRFPIFGRRREVVSIAGVAALRGFGEIGSVKVSAENPSAVFRRSLQLLTQIEKAKRIR